MLMATEKTVGNLAMVRAALEPTAPAPVGLSDPITEWCMVIVRPGMEQEARDAMRRRGVGAWWPNYPKTTMAKDTRNGGRIRRTMLAPVISGIIFSPATFSSLFWNVIEFAPGVVNVARKSYGDIIVLNGVEIVLIHKIEQGLNIPAGSKAVHNFKIGDKVRFADDERSSFGIGKVAKLYRDGRISIEVSGMGRAVAITVTPLQIRRP